MTKSEMRKYKTERQRRYRALGYVPKAGNSSVKNHDWRWRQIVAKYLGAKA